MADPMVPPQPPATNSSLQIRPLHESKIADATHVFRLAFGTILGVPDLETFWADTNYIASRWHADPSRMFAADLGGTIVGSIVANYWGSFGFIGPLTVHPAHWRQAIGHHLMHAAMEQLRARGPRHLGLYTFAQSPGHHALYQQFGFYPRFLTALTSKPVNATVEDSRWTLLSEANTSEQPALITACREITDAIYPGLDVSVELSAVASQRLGETVLIWGGSQLCAFACCHCGPGTEAGNGNCYIKFGAVRPGTDAADHFDDLLRAVEAFALRHGLSRVTAGVNTGRREAYRHVLAAGYRPAVIGVAMESIESTGYNHEQAYLIDDWR